LVAIADSENYFLVCIREALPGTYNIDDSKEKKG
jgi:hypothetical protein